MAHGRRLGVQALVRARPRKVRVIPAVADIHHVRARGTLSTNTSGAIAPPGVDPATLRRGHRQTFAGSVTSQNVQMSGSANLVAMDSLTRTLVAYSTANERAGSACDMIALGNKWLFLGLGANEATVTAA